MLIMQHRTQKLIFMYTCDVPKHWTCRVGNTATRPTCPNQNKKGTPQDLLTNTDVHRGINIYLVELHKRVMGRTVKSLTKLNSRWLMLNSPRSTDNPGGMSLAWERKNLTPAWHIHLLILVWEAVWPLWGSSGRLNRESDYWNEAVNFN